MILNAQDAKKVLEAAGFPSEGVDAVLDGAIVPFIQASQARIAATRCGMRIGTLEFSEVPAHAHAGNFLHSTWRTVKFIDGKGHGYTLSGRREHGLDVEFHIHSTGASDADSLLWDKILEALKKTDAEYDTALVTYNDED